MRHSFRRAWLLVAAFLVALAGMVFVTGTASAAKQSKTLSAESTTQACEIPQCAVDSQSAPAGTLVDTYCTHPEGDFNLTYTGPSRARGGYIPIENFQGPNPANPELCSSFSGAFARAEEETRLRSCSASNCVDFGRVDEGEQLRAFCSVPQFTPQWLLVYVPDSNKTFAGFVEVADLDINPSVPSCSPLP